MFPLWRTIWKQLKKSYKFHKEAWEVDYFIGAVTTILTIVMVSVVSFLLFLTFLLIDQNSGKDVFQHEAVILYKTEAGFVPNRWKKDMSVAKHHTITVEHDGSEVDAYVSKEFLDSHEKGTKLKLFRRIGGITGNSLSFIVKD